jgi:hypothetical protein
MARAAVDVYTESGSKRVFAGALEWPGWCRSAKDEEGALATLVAYGPRYAQVVKGRSAFHVPKSSSDLRVVERLDGDATTDFGAPSAAPKADARPLDARELTKLRKLLEASWAAFDRAAKDAAGKKLATGPRGGGRDLAKIIGHVVGAEASYARKISAKPPAVDERPARAAASEVRAAVLEALSRAVTEGLPERGPRGGRLWTPRYFVRRAAWHVLDHAWEIEDRASG